MKDALHMALQRALALTLEMVDAAERDNWDRVSELDAQRQVHLQHMETGALGMQHREALQALQAHNRALLERAGQVRETVEQQLSQHQYNHRALRTYMTSAR
jgi:flagellar protein FliT